MAIKINYKKEYEESKRLEACLVREFCEREGEDFLSWLDGFLHALGLVKGHEDS